ncbi:MAG TPA: beta-ketoacyl-ACP synthase III [Acidobacteriaceae bacterium]|nr:beta-ketoacyl-ACP synthase III [Acidobacteriaceae bacterium]
MNLSVRPRVPVRAKISAIGTWTPPRLLTNADLEKMVETSDDWITSRVGIKQRHIVEPGMATSHMAVEAAKVCLAARGIDPTEVEVIIVGTVTPDMLFPATACLVQDRLGAKGAWGFDLSAACSGFVYSLQMGCKLVESGAQKKVLVIGADTMSSIIDYTDRATCVLFGDGAGAVLVEPAQDGETGMIDFHHEIDGSGACALFMPGGGSLHPSTHETIDKKMHYVHQDGQAVYKFAVRKMVEATTTILERNGITGADLGCFVAHQANRRIIASTAERLGLPEDKVIINIGRFGNTTCGTIPLALNTAVEEGKVKKGDLVLIASVGAGFTVGSALFRWEI